MRTADAPREIQGLGSSAHDWHIALHAKSCWLREMLCERAAATANLERKGSREHRGRSFVIMCMGSGPRTGRVMIACTWSVRHAVADPGGLHLFMAGVC